MITAQMMQQAPKALTNVMIVNLNMFFIDIREKMQ